MLRTRALNNFIGQVVDADRGGHVAAAMLFNRDGQTVAKSVARLPAPRFPASPQTDAASTATKTTASTTSSSGNIIDNQIGTSVTDLVSSGDVYAALLTNIWDAFDQAPKKYGSESTNVGIQQISSNSSATSVVGGSSASGCSGQVSQGHLRELVIGCASGGLIIARAIGPRPTPRHQTIATATGTVVSGGALSSISSLGQPSVALASASASTMGGFVDGQQVAAATDLEQPPMFSSQTSAGASGDGAAMLNQNHQEQRQQQQYNIELQASDGDTGGSSPLLLQPSLPLGPQQLHQDQSSAGAGCTLAGEGGGGPSQLVLAVVILDKVSPPPPPLALIRAKMNCLAENLDQITFFAKT